MQTMYHTITIAAFMQPFQCDLRYSAAQDNSLTHAPAAPQTFEAATTTALEITAPKPDRDAKAEKCTNLKALG